MARSHLSGVRIAGIVSALPATQATGVELAERFGVDAAERIIKATGIVRRPLAGDGQCTSDLATAAAEALLSGLGWARSGITLLLMVSQTHDHSLPATSVLLQHRLGLERSTAAFDLGLGCSGYVYGLWVASALLAALPAGSRALLLAGDTTSRYLDPNDRATVPLFGDAATATALERDDTAPPMFFDLGSDGAGAPYLMVQGGGMRAPAAPATLFMDGTQVFAFTLREVPPSLRATLEAAGWSLDTVDHVVLHQANAQMIRHLGQRLGARPEQMVLALADTGNTSSASIPLALCHTLAHTTQSVRLLLSGFGVGWSWASAALTCPPLAVCTILTCAVPPGPPALSPHAPGS